MTNTLNRQPKGISIIIPNYNGAHFLESCLKSLLASISLCPQTRFEIILVDNASSDDSVNTFNVILTPSLSRGKNLTSPIILKLSLSKLKNLATKVIQLDRNTGFAYAVNRGIEAARFDYVCVCNNDLTVDKNWFPQIIETISKNKDPQITTFFGLVLNIDGTKVESRGLKFYPYGKAVNIDNGLPVSSLRPGSGRGSNPVSGYSEAEPVEAEESPLLCHPERSEGSPLPHTPHLIWGASASIVVYHKPTLLKVGLFDERFFAYEEDVDLAYRLNKAGYKTLFIPQAISRHLGGGTSSRMGNFRQQHDFKNWILLIAKNYSIKKILANSPSIFIERLRNLSGVVKSTPPLKTIPTLISVFSKTFSALFSSPYKNN